MNGTSDGYSFSQANYDTGASGSGHNLTGDIPQGNATYDAARANMGAPWKMPTKDQCQELIDNTANEWTTINGKTGRKFINKSDSTKYIFLPACGEWVNTKYYDNGIYGVYLCATWNSSSDAWYIDFDSSHIYTHIIYRYVGSSIHPIRHLN